MVRDRNISRSLVATTVAMFWFYFSTLGTFAVNISPATSVIVLIILLSFVLFSTIFTSMKSSRRSNLDLLGLGAVLALIASQFIVGILAEFSFGSTIQLFSLIMLSFAILLLVDGEVLLRGLYLASIWLAITGWLIEIIKINSFHYASGYEFNPLGWRWMGLQSHPNIAGLTMTILFCLAVVKYRNYFVAALALSNVVLAEHRGGLIGIVLASAFITLVKFSSWSLRSRATAVVGWIVFAVLAPLTLVSRLGTDDLSTGRVAIWGLCQNQIEKQPWIGSGPNTMTRIFGQDIFSSTNPFHCHNQLFDDVVNYGWVAGLIPTVLLLTSIFWAVKSRNTVTATVLFALSACWVVETPFRLFATQPSAFVNLIILLVLAKAFGDHNETRQHSAGKSNSNSFSMISRSAELSRLSHS